jgi:hypothetical protein
VFVGTLVKISGREVFLEDARRLWRWLGATECCQLAVEGVKKPKECKFPLTVPEVHLLEAVEIHPLSKEADKSIREVPVWKI